MTSTKRQLQYESDAYVLSQIENAVRQPALYPKLKARMFLSNNASQRPNVIIPRESANEETLIDGIYQPTLKYAFADYGCRLDDGWRIMSRDKDSQDERAQYPWIGSRTNQYGNLKAHETVAIAYPNTVNLNCVVVSADPFGKNNAGLIKNADVYLGTRTSNSFTWILIKRDWTPRDADTGELTALGKLYLQTNGTWSNNNPTQNTSAQCDAIKIVIKQLFVNTEIKASHRGRFVLLYEIDAAYEVDITSDVLSISVGMNRDISSTNLSPIGLSASATFDMQLDNTLSVYDNEDSNSPYYKLLVPNAKFIIHFGYVLPDTTTKYIKYGVYYADTWSTSIATTSVNGRDGAKFLQDYNTPQLSYIGFTLDEVLQDMCDRAGITPTLIDKSALGVNDLATGATQEILGPDDIVMESRNNVIWTSAGDTKSSSSTDFFWAFMQTVAVTDLGVFYFDKKGDFVYKAKETLSDPNNDSFKIKRNLDVSSYILDTTISTEQVTNSFVLNYAIPTLSEFDTGLWEADNPTVLGSTALATHIDADDTYIEAGDISDWQDTGFFKLDDEIIEYQSRTDHAFDDCKRGQLGTKATKHTPDDVFGWHTTEHTWAVSSGQLKVTGNSYKWGFATHFEKDRKFGPNIEYAGHFIINAPPYKTGFTIKNDNGNRYVFIVKTVGEIGNPEEGSREKYNYELYKYINGHMKLIKRKKGPAILTHQQHTFNIVTQDNHLTLYIDQSMVLSHTDSSITGGGYVGLAAIGPGPTLFDNLAVANISQSNTGDKILWRESFGKPIYEVRHIEAQYNNGPATNVQYWMTNDVESKVIRFDPGPFLADIYILNKKDGLTVIEGENPPGSGLNEFMILYGNSVSLTESKNMSQRNKISIRKHGKRELDITLPWVQSDTHAKALLDYLTTIYAEPISFLTVNTVFDPEIDISDMVTVTYPKLGLIRDHFHVTGIAVNWAPDSITQTLTLRSRADATLEKTLGSLFCRVDGAVPDSFYLNGATTTATPSMNTAYKGYTETIYNINNSPVSSLGQTIPFRVWRPSAKSGPVWNGRMHPSTSGATNTALPAIVWIHGEYPRNHKEESNYSVVRWLQKLVRCGYVVAFVDYRGSGGHGEAFYQLESILHDEVNDVEAVGTWLNGQSYVATNRIAFMGHGRGANIAYTSLHQFPTDNWLKAVVAINGTPNAGCSILHWKDDHEALEKRFYQSFGGGPHKNPNEWIAKSPRYNIESIPDTQNNTFARNVCIFHSGFDNLARVEDVYDFYDQMTNYGKTVSAFVYKGKGRDFFFTEDGNDPRKNFTSDWWRRLVQYLNSTL